jgi:hypothetical protein
MEGPPAPRMGQVGGADPLYRIYPPASPSDHHGDAKRSARIEAVVFRVSALEWGTASRAPVGLVWRQEASRGQ